MPKRWGSVTIGGEGGAGRRDRVLSVGAAGEEQGLRCPGNRTVRTRTIITIIISMQRGTREVSMIIRPISQVGRWG